MCIVFLIGHKGFNSELVTEVKVGLTSLEIQLNVPSQYAMEDLLTISYFPFGKMMFSLLSWFLAVMWK